MPRWRSGRSSWPRLLSYIQKFESPETLVLAALALCFALALIGEELGLSAAAGAFLIGAVIGDTPQSEQMTRTISPIRDMFGALFFVSIGMLINVHVIGDHIVPAIVIAAVFIAGKIAVNTFGAFIAGQPDRVPIQFGMRTPQVGEFSLAMVKVGVESQTIGAFMYQVLAAVTAITSLFYPYIVRSSDRVADLLRRRSPEGLRRSLSGYTIGAVWLGGTLSPDLRQRVRGPALSVLVNFLIVVVLMALGALVVGLSPDIARPLGISEGVVAKTVAFAALALSFPSSVAIWRGLERLTEQAAASLILRGRAPRMRVQTVARNLVRDSVMILVIFAAGLWVIPFVAHLLSLGPPGGSAALHGRGRDGLCRDPLSQAGAPPPGRVLQQDLSRGPSSGQRGGPGRCREGGRADRQYPSGRHRALRIRTGRSTRGRACARR